MTRPRLPLALAVLAVFAHVGFATPASATPVDDLGKEQVYRVEICSGGYWLPYPPPSGTVVSYGCTFLDVLRSVVSCDDVGCTYGYEMRAITYGTMTSVSARLCALPAGACVNLAYAPVSGPYVSSGKILVTVAHDDRPTATSSFRISFGATFLGGEAGGADTFEAAYVAQD